MKTLVQDDVQSENVTFFTARCLAVSWAKSPGTVLDGSMGDDRIVCNSIGLFIPSCEIEKTRKMQFKKVGAGLTRILIILRAELPSPPG